MFRVSGLRHFVIHFGDGFPHGRALQLEAVGVVDDAIQDGVGEGGLADPVMPRLDGFKRDDATLSGRLDGYGCRKGMRSLLRELGCPSRMAWRVSAM